MKARVITKLANQDWERLITVNCKPYKITKSLKYMRGKLHLRYLNYLITICTLRRSYHKTRYIGSFRKFYGMSQKFFIIVTRKHKSSLYSLFPLFTFLFFFTLFLSLLPSPPSSLPLSSSSSSSLCADILSTYFLSITQTSVIFLLLWIKLLYQTCHIKLPVFWIWAARYFLGIPDWILKSADLYTCT